MVTIKQVSQFAGVSSATVSRVINNADSVTEKTRQSVLEAMRTLGYRHNVIAASLASNKTHSIGCVIPELHGAFYGGMTAGSEEILRQAHKHMFVVAGHSNEKQEMEEIEALLSRRCDGLILHVEGVSDDYLIDLVAQDTPVIIVNRYIEQISDNCIHLDNLQGGYLATQALIARGHKRIAYIAGSMFKADSQQRLQGHKQALQQAGLDFAPALFAEGDFSARSGELAMQQILDRQSEFTALACGNDAMASGAIHALKESGLTVPDDVSVVGFDNIEFSSYLTPKLSTIDFPMGTIGTLAARWMLNRAYGDASMQVPHILAPQLIDRESIAAAKA